MFNSVFYKKISQNNTSEQNTLINKKKKYCLI